MSTRISSSLAVRLVIERIVGARPNCSYRVHFSCAGGVMGQSPMVVAGIDGIALVEYRVGFSSTMVGHREDVEEKEAVKEASPAARDDDVAREDDEVADEETQSASSRQADEAQQPKRRIVTRFDSKYIKIKVEDAVVSQTEFTGTINLAKLMADDGSIAPTEIHVRQRKRRFGEEPSETQQSRMKVIVSLIGVEFGFQHQLHQEEVAAMKEEQDGNRPAAVDDQDEDGEEDESSSPKSILPPVSPFAQTMPFEDEAHHHHEEGAEHHSTGEERQQRIARQRFEERVLQGHCGLEHEEAAARRRLHLDHEHEVRASIVREAHRTPRKLVVDEDLGEGDEHRPRVPRISPSRMQKVEWAKPTRAWSVKSPRYDPGSDATHAKHAKAEEAKRALTPRRTGHKAKPPSRAVVVAAEDSQAPRTVAAPLGNFARSTATSKCKRTDFDPSKENGHHQPKIAPSSSASASSRKQHPAAPINEKVPFLRGTAASEVKAERVKADKAKGKVPHQDGVHPGWAASKAIHISPMRYRNEIPQSMALKAREMSAATTTKRR